MLDDTNKVEAARHIIGATIPMGDGTRFDCMNPEATPVCIEDYAYAMAYTVRFRGQTRCNGRRVFYGDAEHCVRMADQIRHDGHGDEHALAGLMHEPGEVPFGDMSAPLKPLFPEFRGFEQRCGAAILSNLGIRIPDPALIKRYDIRMYLTEKRDLMPGGLPDVTPGYEPFEWHITPYRHPDDTAVAFLRLFHALRGAL